MKKKLFYLLASLLTIVIAHPAKAQLDVTAYFNSISPGRHYYSTNTSVTNQAPTGSGWNNLGVVGHLYSPVPFAPGTPGVVPVYQFYRASNNSWYYTNDINRHPAGYVLQATLGVYLTDESTYGPLIPVYEFYNDGDYAYSTGSTTPTGYVYDGVAFYYNGPPIP